jgi:hypothetical protein
LNIRVSTNPAKAAEAAAVSLSINHWLRASEQTPDTSLAGSTVEKEIKTPRFFRSTHRLIAAITTKANLLDNFGELMKMRCDVRPSQEKSRTCR